MIAIDTSALVALAFKEATAPALAAALGGERLLISGATVAEALIVARRRGYGQEMATLLALLDAEIVPVTGAFAEQVANAYDQWGKGVHPAGLNFADCFAYALALENACPLLYVGDDFAKTDILSALRA